MNAPGRALRVNPDWAKLPLFDRSKWRRVRFGDVVRALREEVDPSSGEVDRYVAGEHMDSESVHIRRWGTVGDGYLGPAFHRRFRRGQVLYGSRRTYLKKVAVAEWDGVTANTTFVLQTVRERMLQELLPWLMLSDRFTRHSIAESKGSTNPYINWPDIAKFELDLPPLEQQAQIAAVLSGVEETIERTAIAKSALDSSRGFLFDQALQTGTNKEPRSLRRLGDALAAIVAGKSPKAASKPARDSEFGVLKVSAVGDGEYVEEENKALLARDDFDVDLEVKPGMILVTRANALLSGVGRACLVAKTRTGLMLSDKTLQLVPDESRIDPRFLLHGLRRNPYRDYVENAANGTGAKNISQEKLRNAPFWIPDLKRQREIAAKMEELNSALESTSSQLSRLIELRTTFVNTIVQ